MNYRMISYILGWILIFEGLFLSVPMLTAIVYGESVLPSYLIAMGTVSYTHLTLPTKLEG